MDESGDLGFDLSKKGTSRFFVVSFLIVDDLKPLEKIVKKICGLLKPKEIWRLWWALHCCRLHDDIRKKIFSHLNQASVKVMSIVLDKTQLFIDIQKSFSLLYIELVQALLHQIWNDTDIQFIASRMYTNRLLNKEFEAYITKTLSDKLQKQVSIKILTPNQSKGLQLVDAVFWSVYKKYELWDGHFFDTYLQQISLWNFEFFAIKEKP